MADKTYPFGLRATSQICFSFSLEALPPLDEKQRKFSNDFRMDPTYYVKTCSNKYICLSSILCAIIQGIDDANRVGSLLHPWIKKA